MTSRHFPLLLLLLLTACSVPGEIRQPLTPSSISEAAKFSRFYYIPANARPDSLFGTKQGPTEWISVNIRGYGAGIVNKGSGPGYPFQVKISHSPRSAVGSRVEVLDIALAAASAFASDANDASAARSLADQVARATFCRGGRVSDNRDLGTRYSNPADIGRIIAQNGRVPAGVRGRAVPAVDRDPLGNWVFSLRCSLWQLD